MIYSRISTRSGNTVHSLRLSAVDMYNSVTLNDRPYICNRMITTSCMNFGTPKWYRNPLHTPKLKENRCRQLSPTVAAVIQEKSIYGQPLTLLRFQRPPRRSQLLLLPTNSRTSLPDLEDTQKLYAEGL